MSSEHIVSLAQMAWTADDSISSPSACFSMALQFSLQNMLDLVKYVVTMILNQPSEFKCTRSHLSAIGEETALTVNRTLDSSGAVLISFCAVVCGAACYLIYAKKERGHLVHLEWTERLLHKAR